MNPLAPGTLLRMRLAWPEVMARNRTRRRLQHDRMMLAKALEDYEAGAMAHLDESEQASLLESLTRRIAEIDARIESLDDA